MDIWRKIWWYQRLKMPFAIQRLLMVVSCTLTGEASTAPWIIRHWQRSTDSSVAWAVRETTGTTPQWRASGGSESRNGWMGSIRQIWKQNNCFWINSRTGTAEAEKFFLPAWIEEKVKKTKNRIESFRFRGLCCWGRLSFRPGQPWTNSGQKLIQFCVVTHKYKL